MHRNKTRALLAAGLAALLALSLAAPGAATERPGRTERASVSSDGVEGNGNSARTAVSADGRFVAFESNSTNLVAGITNDVGDVFVRDRQAGTIERVNVASDGTEANASSFHPGISHDGRYVAFASDATNLVPGIDNGRRHVYVHDRETGDTEVLSRSPEGEPGDGDSQLPALSADGRHVAFRSGAKNLVTDGPDFFDHIYVHDRQTGETEVVSVSSNGTPGNRSSWQAAISADGRFVTYQTQATNLVDAEVFDGWGIYLHDRDTGETELISKATGGTPANERSYWPSVSGDGRYVAFDSYATNLVPRRTDEEHAKQYATAGQRRHVYVRDRAAGATERVSVTTDMEALVEESAQRPAISDDGRHVAFEFKHTICEQQGPLTVCIVNHIIHAHDRLTGVSENAAVELGERDYTGASGMPSISADGRYVGFYSVSPNLVPEDTNGMMDAFIRDRGPNAGVAELDAELWEGAVTVGGWAGFHGATVTAASAEPDDALLDGLTFTGADLVYRPEQADLLARLRLAGPPGSAAAAQGGVGEAFASPGATYGLSLVAGGVRYELRATGVGATTVPPHYGPTFTLHRCAPVCVETAAVPGGFGLHGNEVRMTVPLAALGLREGDAVSAVRAFAGAGEAAVGAPAEYDSLALDGGEIPTRSVSLRIAPAPESPGQPPQFDTAVEPAEDGAFAAALDATDLRPGAYKVWARGCLGEDCRFTSTPFTVPED